ncbi:DUF2029 domain-containing protein [Rhodococcus sp. G-MC3]|uniref:DUF2029 domain-containing protein n=1 Tax=Rhodococcus sp. G-MC3 TaxID=3046209 RepID=UPI0024B8E432|nr:DUF2029 domain-containing protein [Rhodococcus sp. G-MC3]MDJ0395972.1 DUF2029 domain-containing protein [Rhodococcus sp. G-MC3]
MNAFMKTLRFVGDLDDEFYDDERQRDVWNEASAIGFQLFLWTALIAAAVLPWVGGRTGAFVALGLLIALSAITTLTTGYSWARGVNLYTASKIGRMRGFVSALIILIGYFGVWVKLHPGLSTDVSSWAGGLVGGLLGGGAVAAGIWYLRRRNAKFENEEI